MRNYEIMFILSTQLTDEEKQAGIKLVEDTLAKAGAVEIKTEVWGDRKLAYPIKKKELDWSLHQITCPLKCGLGHLYFLLLDAKYFCKPAVSFEARSQTSLLLTSKSKIPS